MKSKSHETQNSSEIGTHFSQILFIIGVTILSIVFAFDVVFSN